MKLRPRNYELDDSLSTDEAFNSLDDDEEGYEDDDSLLRSAGGDAIPVKLNHTHSRFSDFQPDRLDGIPLDDEPGEEIEAVTLEEIQTLLGTDTPVSGEEDVG